MPRYYFNLESHLSFDDREGQLLPGIEEARQIAASIAGELLRARAQEFCRSNPWRVTVTDHERLVLFRVELGITQGPPSRVAHRADG